MLAAFNIEDLQRVITASVAEAIVAAKPSPWLGSEAAAEYLGCTPGTLKTWRSRGEGPRYHIIQSKLVRYHVEDLDAFVRGEENR